MKRVGMDVRGQSADNADTTPRQTKSPAFTAGLSMLQRCRTMRQNLYCIEMPNRSPELSKLPTRRSPVALTSSTLPSLTNKWV